MAKVQARSGMAPSAITDDLLRTAVGLRMDAGVSSAKIERLIDRFSAGQPRQSTGDRLPWLGAPGIPQDRREELLQELAGLPSDPDHSPADTRRTMSANDIWPLRIAEEAKMHRTGPIEEATTDFADAPEPAPHAEPMDVADLEWAWAPFEETMQDQFDGAQNPPAPVDHFASMPETDSKEGGTTVDQVEFVHMKQELGLRRDEILTRHAKELKEMLASHSEELRALDADHKEVETVELAIDALLRKFKPSSPDASVARFDEERALRLQGLA